MVDLEALIRKMVAGGARRQAIVGELESQMAAAEERVNHAASQAERDLEERQIEWIRRILFFLKTRLVPRDISDADMAVYVTLQDVR
jgi:hypothetical protein